MSFELHGSVPHSSALRADEHLHVDPPGCAFGWMASELLAECQTAAIPGLPCCGHCGIWPPSAGHPWTPQLPHVCQAEGLDVTAQ